MARSDVNRRGQRRISVRASLTVISLDSNHTDVRPVIINGWTEDVSLSGALIMTKVPIEEQQVWIRFLMPGTTDHLVEAEVVRQEQRGATYFQRTGEQLHVYGVKFRRVIDDPTIINWLLSAIRGESEQAVPEQIRERFRTMQAHSIRSPHI